jgi:hypothetical protein
VAATLSILSVTLAGCAGLGDGPLSGAFVDPAKYQLYDCKQMETERASLNKRIADLQRLIDKARTGVGGAAVGEIAYRNDYISARASLKLLNETWDEAKCVASPPAPPTGSLPQQRPYGLR